MSESDEKTALRLIEELSHPTDIMAEFRSMFSGMRTSSDALDELASLLVAEGAVADTLKRHGLAGEAAKSKLIELSISLYAGGANWPVRGVPFSISALCTPKYLDRVLVAQSRGVGNMMLEKVAWILSQGDENAFQRCGL
ncbi:MAG TPA: hypothetical protein VME40_17860 [Caulobacteraceae bacterium]|nr:hypothetical protein [Caulobacteraceae bacterium]